MASVLAAGQIVGTYAIVRRVGAGGMGEIYEVSHNRLAGRYAMKVLRAEVAANSEALLRFQREAKVTSSLQHPNIVQVIDFSMIDGGQPYLVMEFLEGPELAQVMKGAQRLATPQIVSYVKQIASGLTAAHEHGVVHRDLKPQNIFVLKVSGSDQALIKIVDFGISKMSAVTATITSASTVIGTAQYMSPEQARGQIDEIDAKTDQFSLALIIYEMLTGQHAFHGENVSSLVYQIVHEEPRALVDPGGPIPPALVAVLKRALEKDKARRFPTVKAFADAFEGAATSPVEASATTIVSTHSLLDAGVRAEVTSRGRFGLAVGIVALTVAAIAGFTFLRRDPPRPIETSARGASSGPIPEPTPPSAPAAVSPTVVRNVLGPATTTISERPKANAVRLNRPLKKVSATRTPPTPQTTNCSPNYTIDAEGDKHFKAECFLEKKAAP
jgi:serine/threonine protein kinase